MATPTAQPTVERERQTLSGWVALVFVILWFAAVLAFIASAAQSGADGSLPPPDVFLRILSAALMFAFGVLLCCGFFTLEPNEARVLILFGAYKGTVRRSGFHWANPLYARGRGVAPGSAATPATVKLGPLSMSDGRLSRPRLKTKLSLRAHNFNSQTLKVNDKRGNPSCHDPHSSDNFALLVKPAYTVCTECHEAVAKAPHVMAGFGSKGHPLGVPKKEQKGKKPEEVKDPKREGKPFTCASCHNPHSSDYVRLYRYPAKSPMELCSNCHKY